MAKRFRVEERIGPRIQTTDAARRHRDELITTSMRINAEPAPPAPDLGVRYDGNPRYGVMATQDDMAEVQQSLAENGLISKADVSAIQAILAKYSGRSAGRTTQAGVSTADANAQVRDGVRVIQDVQKQNDAFWKDHLAALR